MAPPEIRQPRRVLRYRNLLVQQAVRLKNRIGGVLMECGEQYVKSRLHGKAYFYQLLDRLQHTPESAGTQQRGPLSKQRNKHLQRVSVEATKLVPRFNPELREGRKA